MNNDLDTRGILTSLLKQKPKGYYHLPPCRALATLEVKRTSDDNTAYVFRDIEAHEGITFPNMNLQFNVNGTHTHWSPEYLSNNFYIYSSISFTLRERGFGEQVCRISRSETRKQSQGYHGTGRDFARVEFFVRQYLGANKENHRLEFAHGFNESMSSLFSPQEVVQPLSVRYIFIFDMSISNYEYDPPRHSRVFLGSTATEIDTTHDGRLFITNTMTQNTTPLTGFYMSTLTVVNAMNGSTACVFKNKPNGVSTILDFWDNFPDMRTNLIGESNK